MLKNLVGWILVYFIQTCLRWTFSWRGSNFFATWVTIVWSSFTILVHKVATGQIKLLSFIQNKRSALLANWTTLPVFGWTILNYCFSSFFFIVTKWSYRILYKWTNRWITWTILWSCTVLPLFFILFVIDFCYRIWLF